MSATSAFVITPLSPRLSIVLSGGQPGTGTAVFTVTNTTDRPLRARATVRAQNPTSQPWFSVAEPVERLFPLQGTEQLTVQLTVPPGTPIGQFPFQLLVAGVESPDDEFGLSPSVIVDLGLRPAPPPAPTPWRWLILAGVVGLILIAVVAGILLSRRDDTAVVPDVTGKPLAEAIRDLTAAGFSVEVNQRGPAGNVTGQVPAAGIRATSGSTVKLEFPAPSIFILPAPITAPVVVGRPVDDAVRTLNSAGLFISRVRVKKDTQAPANSVQEQNPAGNSATQRGNQAELVVAVR